MPKMIIVNIWGLCNNNNNKNNYVSTTKTEKIKVN